VYRSGRPVTINQTQIDLIRDLYCKDATPQEMELFLQICKSSRLDPFKREIYFIKFDTRRGPVMVIIVGIDGFHSMAARSHKDYGGVSAAKYTWFDPMQKTTQNRKIPETATVIAKRTNGTTTEATVYWEEFAPADMSTDRADFWRRMPKRMLEKCAEAQVLRKTFPGLGNIFVAEELEQKMADYTPEGRQIHTEGVAPSGAIVDPYVHAKAQQKKIVEEKLAAHGHEPGSAKAKMAEATLDRVEAEDARFTAAKKVSGTKEPEPPRAEGGTPVDAGAKPQKPKIPPGSEIVRGTLHRCVSGKTSKNAITRDVLINRTWYKCYRTTLHPHFDMYGHSSSGFVIEAYLDKNKAIIGLIRIGPTKFAEDGATPITPISVPPREPGEEG
jgi:phage recombination protein Bet